MQANRRDILRYGLGLAAFGLTSRAAAAPGGAGILWVNVQANGGWDQALFCDPKPALRGPHLVAGDGLLRQAGNIPYLSFADFGAAPDQGFFGRNHEALTVINGIDTATNNHDVGLRYSSSGSINDGFPCLSAQLAAVLEGGAALPFIDGGGGYGEAGGLIVPARILGENVPQFAPVFNYLKSTTTANTFAHPDIAAKVHAAHLARLSRLAASAVLPEEKQALETLITARTGQEKLANVAIPPAKQVSGGLTDYIVRLIDFAFNAHLAGQSVSLNLSFGGFDTHDDNENGQRNALKRLLAHVGYIMERAEDVAFGGANKRKVVVVVNSDFGRTPHRTGSGTDHWQIASMLVLQSSLVRGTLQLPSDTVIGATDANLGALKVNPTTLALDANGVTLTPGHIVNALRRAAGIAQSPKLTPYPIELAQELDLG